MASDDTTTNARELTAKQKEQIAREFRAMRDELAEQRQAVEAIASLRERFEDRA